MCGEEVFILDREYGIYISQLVAGFMMDQESADCIGWHGHTLFHYPSKKTTVQIGHPLALANYLNLPVVSDFRQTDVFLGGQGAPVAPIVEKVCLPGYDYYLNLGGIANISAHSESSIIGGDICACNQILNYTANRLNLALDRDGLLARSGCLIPELLKDLAKIPYLQCDIPKSLDNREVQRLYFPILDQFTHLPVSDVLHTLVEHIATQIQTSLDRGTTKSNHKTRLLATGGGAFNTYLVEVLSQYLQPMDIELCIPSPQLIEFKEALLMAIMAYLYFDRQPNVLQTVTGAKFDSIGGVLSLPYDYNMQFEWD